jgi:magnesium transporter
MASGVSASTLYERSAVASTHYAAGQAPRDVGLDELGTTADSRHGLLWVGLKDPEDSLLRQVGERLNLPRRAVEEILSEHRRPKIVEYAHLTLIVAITVEIARDRPAMGEIQLLIGSGYILTIRRHSSSSHRELRTLLTESPDFQGRGSDYVASALLELLADRYVDMLQQLETMVEGVEHQFLLRGLREVDIRGLYRHRRDLLRIQTAIAPLAEICRRMAHVETRNIGADSRADFAEIGDRIQRVTESVSGLREALAFAFEAAMMIGQMQQTDITRKLAAWAAILAVPTAVAGIYGMNFHDMPELSWRFGYPAVLISMFAVCAVLYWKFKRIRWL